jgi:hypothetical protein
MNSATVLAGTDGWTSITNGARLMLATGARSRVTSKFRRNQEKRVAVRGCPHHRLGGDIAAGAGPVLDNERLSEPLGECLAD